MDKLQQFIDTNYGKSDVGDTPENKSQCVGLIECWTDALGLPHTWGNAKDLLANADTSKFTVVYNDPNNLSQYPPVGAVFVFDETWGNGVGHTGIVVATSGTSFVGFEQNNPKNCRFIVHTFEHLLGWFFPKDAIIAQPIAQTDQTIIDLGAHGKMEVQKIRSELDDKARLEVKVGELQSALDNLKPLLETAQRDYKGALAQAEDIKRQFEEYKLQKSTLNYPLPNLPDDVISYSTDSLLTRLFTKFKQLWKNS